MRENVLCYEKFTSWRLKCPSASPESAHSLVVTTYSRHFFALTRHFSAQIPRIAKQITIMSLLNIVQSISVKKLWGLNSKFPAFRVFYWQHVSEVIHSSKHSSLFSSFSRLTQGVVHSQLAFFYCKSAKHLQKTSNNRVWEDSKLCYIWTMVCLSVCHTSEDTPAVVRFLIKARCITSFCNFLLSVSVLSIYVHSSIRTRLSPLF